MKKTEPSFVWVYRSMLVSMFLAGFLLLAFSGYLSTPTVLAQDQAKPIF